jgi:SRSO17 transposase
MTQVLDERLARKKKEKSTIVSSPYCGNTPWNENPRKQLPSTLNSPLLLQVTGWRAEVQGGEAEREVR